MLFSNHKLSNLKHNSEHFCYSQKQTSTCSDLLAWAKKNSPPSNSEFKYNNALETNKQLDLMTDQQ